MTAARGPASSSRWVAARREAGRAAPPPRRHGRGRRRGDAATVPGRGGRRGRRRSTAGFVPHPTTTHTGSTCGGRAPRGSLDARSLRILEPPAFSLQAARDGAGDALRLALPEPEAGLAAGILIGLRERVDRDLAADFSTAGVSHVVAISGWNIAIVAALVGAALRGRPRRLVTIGRARDGRARTSSPRAARRPSSGRRDGGRRAARQGVRPCGTGGRRARAAAAILLLVDPALIGDAGFRLSVLATAGLLAWANPIGAWLARLGGGRTPGWLAESLGISLAAQAATLPDVLATFGRLSIVSPAVNLAVVPLVPVAMAGGVLALVGGLATAVGAPAFVGTLVGLPGWLVLHVVIAIVRVGAAVPFAARDAPAGCRPAARGPHGRRPPRRAVRAEEVATSSPPVRIAGSAATGHWPPGSLAPRPHAPAIGRRSSRDRSLSRSRSPPSATRADGRRGSRSSTSGRATRSCSRRGPGPGCSSTAARTPTGSSSRWTSGSRHGTGGSTS